jgi:hypothetical protein
MEQLEHQPNPEESIVVTLEQRLQTILEEIDAKLEIISHEKSAQKGQIAPVNPNILQRAMKKIGFWDPQSDLRNAIGQERALQKEKSAILSRLNDLNEGITLTTVDYLVQRIKSAMGRVFDIPFDGGGSADVIITTGEADFDLGALASVHPQIADKLRKELNENVAQTMSQFGYL